MYEYGEKMQLVHWKRIRTFGMLQYSVIKKNTILRCYLPVMLLRVRALSIHLPRRRCSRREMLQTGTQPVVLRHRTPSAWSMGLEWNGPTRLVGLFDVTQSLYRPERKHSTVNWDGLVLCRGSLSYILKIRLIDAHHNYRWYLVYGSLGLCLAQITHFRLFSYFSRGVLSHNVIFANFVDVDYPRSDGCIRLFLHSIVYCILKFPNYRFSKL